MTLRTIFDGEVLNASTRESIFTSLTGKVVEMGVKIETTKAEGFFFKKNNSFYPCMQ